MQTLKLYDDLMDDVEAGKKVTTIRKGDRGNELTLGPLTLVSTQNPERKLVVDLHQYNVLYAKDIFWLTLEMEGFSSGEKFYEGMQKYYPEFGPETICTVIYFQLVEIAQKSH